MRTSTKKTKTGVVVSNKMDKTIVVRVDERRAHARYNKTINVSNKFHAHDEKNDAQVGDEVLIAETRKLSKTKNWRLVEVTKRHARELAGNVEINESNVSENI